MIKTIDYFDGEYRWLSNFSTAGGVKPTLEHQFQARKATTVEDAIYVMAAETPGGAKKRGRSITCRDDWDDIKLDVMYELLVEKFSLSPLKEKLLATGDAELVEGNTWGDTFWGRCRGKGKNNLGYLLMIIRQDIRSGRIGL